MSLDVSVDGDDIPLTDGKDYRSGLRRFRSDHEFEPRHPQRTRRRQGCRETFSGGLPSVASGPASGIEVVDGREPQFASGMDTPMMAAVPNGVVLDDNVGQTPPLYKRRSNIRIAEIVRSGEHRPTVHGDGPRQRLSMRQPLIDARRLAQLRPRER